VPDPIKVRVANGQIITCTSEIRQAEWVIKDNKFVADLKVIPLPYYYIILVLRKQAEGHGDSKTEAHPWA
jgi:hypothetical protein